MPVELFDIVDENDQVIGQETRDRVHQLGLWHRGAHVLLLTQDNRLIVQKRSETKSQSPLALDCSVSEHVTAGETYHHAAKRGLKEELGLTGITIEPMTKFKMNYGPNDNEISMIFKGVADLGRIRFDPQEIERVDEYTPEELQNILEQRPDACSYWFEQILLWYFQKPSALQILDAG